MSKTYRVQTAQRFGKTWFQGTDANGTKLGKSTTAGPATAWLRAVAADSKSAKV